MSSKTLVNKIHKVLRLPSHLPVLSRVEVFLIAYLLFWLTYFFWLWSHQLTQTPNGITAGWIGSWADGSVHLSYISTFAQRLHFPAFHPLFWHHPFTYAFGADLIGGILVRMGLPIFFVYNFLGFVFSSAIVCLLPLLIFRLTKSKSIAIVSACLWFFSGGLGGLVIFEDIIASGFWPTISHLPQEYTHIGEKNIEWINILSGEMVPQRAFLLGLMLGLIAFILLWKIYSNPKTTPPKIFLALGIIMGVMPIVHPHTLIVLSLFTLWVFIFSVRKAPFKNWFYLGIPAAAIGIPLLLNFVIAAAGSSGFFRFYAGWMAKSKHENWLWFWFINWGFLPLFSLLGLFHLQRRLKIFLIPFYLLFILANLFLFQPYDWDNSKILTWVYLGFTIPAAALINYFISPKRRWLLVAFFLFVSLSFSGFLDAFRLLDFEKLNIPMFSNEELTLAKIVKEQTSPESVFLTSDQHNHFIPTLTGRQIIMGYRGWLWTYGINYTNHDEDVRSIYSGGVDTSRLLKKYDINFLVIGPSERNDFHANTNYFIQYYPLLVQTENYKIFKITPG